MLQAIFGFWEIASCPVNFTHLTTFRHFKITTTNDIQKITLSAPALFIIQYTGNEGLFGSIDTETLFLVQKQATQQH